MTGTFYLLAETDHARRFTTDPNKLAQAFWVPKSVCPRTLKMPPAFSPDKKHWVYDVEIEDWWWEKHTQPIRADSRPLLPGGSARRPHTS